MSKVLFVKGSIGGTVAYGGVERDPDTGELIMPAVTLKPGYNTVADAVMMQLEADVHYVAHAAKGFILDVTPSAPVADSAARLRQEGEKERDYLKRMKAAGLEPLPLPKGDEAAFLSAYDAMSDEDKAVYYDAMLADEKALVDAHRLPPVSANV